PLRPSRATLFPYTTLFRSHAGDRGQQEHGVLDRLDGVPEVGQRLDLAALDDRRLFTGDAQGSMDDMDRCRRWRVVFGQLGAGRQDRKSTRLNSSHVSISYA